MLPDYHIHTTLCKHATGDVAEYKSEAEKQGIPEICFSDHAPNPDGYYLAHSMGLEQFPSYREMVKGLQNGETPEVLLGMEIEYYEGCERFLREWLPARKFDFVLGSVHFIEDWGFDQPRQLHLWDSADITDTWRAYFNVLLKFVESGLFDAVAHIDLPKKFGHRPKDKDLKEMARPVLDRIARSGMGIELNTSGLRKPVGEIYPSPLIVSMAREREIPICFGSDAHCPEDVGDRFTLALDLAREAGYTEYFRVRQRKKELVRLPEA
jgi:histidinol-phosphatase (PHP family)